MRIAPAVCAAMASVIAMPLIATAEPMLLSDSQMDAATAGASIEVRPSINLTLGGISVQTNVTTQVANAIALAISNCGICIGGAPRATSVAAASNVNAGIQFQR